MTDLISVSKVSYRGKDYLKIKLSDLDPSFLHVLKTINGWFKGQEPLVFGLPYDRLGEFIQKTKDFLVVWQSQADQMGAMVRGVDTKDIPKDYIVEYTPKEKLRQHQIELFNLLLMRDSLLISDEEGVGKTAPILCSIDAKIKHGTAKLALYVTKAGLIYDVYNQTRQFTGLSPVVISGGTSRRCELYKEVEKGKYNLVIVSYETFRKDIDQFKLLQKRVPIDIMCCDEAHKIKSATTDIGRYIHKVNARQRYAITASPIINNVLDLYNIFYWAGWTNYSYEAFRDRYCELDRYKRPVRYKNLSEIKAILQSNMIRRLKVEVLKDLPPVVHKYIYAEMTPAQKKLYKLVEEGRIEGIDFEDLEFEEIPSELARYARLAQIAESAEIVGGEKGTKGSGKLKELEELLEDIVSRNEKAIVFTRSKRFTYAMYKYFEKYNPAIITGDISTQAKAGQDASERQKQVDKFQKDPSCKVIFCTESAAREGWTGTEANNVIFTSKPWSPAYVNQCIGRSHRFGAQKHNVINVYTIISKETIDERIEELLAGKQFLIKSMVDTPLTTKEILQILDKK